MTVVIRTNGLLMRADVRGASGDTSGGGGAPLVKRWRDNWSTAAEAVTHALDEGGRPGRRVWVLDSEVWLGVVELPSSAVAGLSEKDLADPAAYEAEAISELRPTEAITAVQRRRMADQDDQFLVAQARRIDVIAIARAVRSAGAKLAGISHPAGPGEAMAFDGQADDLAGAGWRRVEFWTHTVVLAESVAGRVGLIPLGIAPGRDWRRALEPLLRHREPVAADQTLLEPGVRVRGGPNGRENVAVSGTARWLSAGEDQSDEDDGVPVWDLADDAAAEQFAAAWARRLNAVDPAGQDMSPTLRPPKAPAARWPAVAVGVLALALAVTAVLMLRGQAADRLDDLRGELEHAQADQKMIADHRQKANAAQAEVRKKQRAVEDLQRRLEQLQRQRTASQPVNMDQRPALAAMMAALTDSASEQVVIQSIDHGSPQHEITGMALTPEAASRLARELSGALRDHWAVSPARIEPKPGPQRVVWEFSITIEPAVGMEARR
jgi:hypothetical protein